MICGCVCFVLFCFVLFCHSRDCAVGCADPLVPLPLLPHADCPQHAPSLRRQHVRAVCVWHMHAIPCVVVVLCGCVCVCVHESVYGVGVHECVDFVYVHESVYGVGVHECVNFVCVVRFDAVLTDAM